MYRNTEIHAPALGGVMGSLSALLASGDHRSSVDETTVVAPRIQNGFENSHTVTAISPSASFAVQIAPLLGSWLQH